LPHHPAPASRLRHRVVARGRRRASLLLLIAAPGSALAHAFGERYDLPVPLGYFVVGAAATVALSFAIAALFMRRAPRAPAGPGLVVRLGTLAPALRAVGRAVGGVALAMVVVAGLAGTRNPEMNLAPVLVWIVWWVGLTLVVACVGNIWPALDPWRALFDWADGAARRLGLPRGITVGAAYPARLGAWPAVWLLLAFVWIEVLYPDAVLPSRLAHIVLAWSAVTLAGMACFGADTWQRNADVFALYFATLGRFAPVAAGPDARSIVLRPPGRGLIESPAGSRAMVGFVLAMLATVLFDGLLGTQLMVLIHTALNVRAPWLVDARGYLLGSVGLVAVWLTFLLAYLAACQVTARLVGGRSAGAVARLFAYTLVPIAIAYTIAHYFTYLLVHGQLIIPLVSDPLGRGWDLFGTQRFYPDIGIVSARATWHLAIAAIVFGHIVAIWLAHRLALREFASPRQAVIASIPLTVLMVIYTAISLLVMAEPLVQFTGAAGAP
jgi:hypothetical protein